MSKSKEGKLESNGAIRCARCISLLATTILVGCRSVTVHHVPKVGTISPTEMSDLHGTPPVDVEAGESSSVETVFGSVGVGKVVGKPSEWTVVCVDTVCSNLVSRGATLLSDAPKKLIIAMTRARVKAIPFIGVSQSTVFVRATNPQGLDRTFEGIHSSAAPLGAVDGATKDAITKLLKDSKVDAYLHNH